MVGRASKKRRTRANDRNEDIESQVPPMAEAVETFATVSSTEDVDSSLQEFLGNYAGPQPLLSSAVSPFWLPTENFLLDPSTGHDLFSGFEDTSGSGEVKSSHLHELPTNKEHTKRNGDEPDKFNQHQTLKSMQSRMADQIESGVPLSYRDRSTVSKYPHAAALMAIIESLEEQIQISHVAIDQAMRVNRQSIKKLQEVSNTEGFQSCQSCPLLMTTIMDLVVGLYEVVIIALKHPEEEGASQKSSHGNQIPSRYPSDTDEVSSNTSSPVSAFSSGSDVPVFQFGCLEFDPDEQEIFRTAMIRRDLRKCKDMIRYCSQEGSKRKRTADALIGAAGLRRPVNGKIQANCYEELEWRVEELLISLPSSCGHS